jgi:GT2 family glycosyltransferase
LQILKSWADRGVRVIENPANLGYASAHNQAIAATDREFVLTLNPDALLAPRFVEVAVAAMDATPTVGSVSGKLIQISAAQLAWGTDRLAHMDAAVIDSAGLLMRRSRRQALRGYQERHDAWGHEPARIFGPDGSVAFYRRAMLEDVAYRGESFDETFVIHKEDVDLAWRAQLLGWDSLFVPAAVAYHVRGFRPFIAVYEAGILGYLVLRERSSLPAIQEFLRLVPEALARRKDIHRRRKRSSREIGRWFADSTDVAFPLTGEIAA